VRKLNKQINQKCSTTRYVSKNAYSTKFLAASSQVQARIPAHRMLGRSVINFREHRNLGTRPPNVHQPSSRLKRIKEYRLEGAANYQPAKGAKLLACPGGLIISLPGAPNYQPPRGAKLSASQGRQMISLPGAPNDQPSRGAK
jgi:hypothetical protein